MIKQAISAFAAAAVAVSFASAAFAEEASVVEKIPTTNFTFIGDDSNGAKIEDSKIILTNSFGKIDLGDNVPETYLSYTASDDGKLSITFSCDKTNTKSPKNKPRLYQADASNVTETGDHTLTKNHIVGLTGSPATLTGGATESSGANQEAVFTMETEKGKTYYLFGYVYGVGELTFTLTNFKFTSTADITAAAEYEPIKYNGTDKGFTVDFKGSAGNSLTWYAKSSGAAAYSKIGSVYTGITGEDSTTFTAGLVISDMGDKASNYNIGASIN